MKNSVVFYLSHYEIVKSLPNETLGKLYRTIFEYELGNEIEIDEEIKFIFGFIYNQIKMDKQKYEEKCKKNKENGKKGGRPKKPNGFDENQNKPNGFNENQNKANGYFENPNDNENDNENENDNDNENENVNVNENNIICVPKETQDNNKKKYETIINRLNQLTGSDFRASAKSTQELIKSLLKDYTVDDIILVIDKMCYKWGNDKKMCEYLRPSTLFRRSNFENYLGMKVVEKEITTKDIAQYVDIGGFLDE